jgi:hypothetical protein
MSATARRYQADIISDRGDGYTLRTTATSIQEALTNIITAIAPNHEVIAIKEMML